MSDGAVVTVTYTENGVTRTYNRPAAELWDLIERADAKFADPVARASEPERYRRAIEHQRQTGSRR